MDSKEHSGKRSAFLFAESKTITFQAQASTEPMLQRMLSINNKQVIYFQRGTHSNKYYFHIFTHVRKNIYFQGNMRFPFSKSHIKLENGKDSFLRILLLLPPANLSSFFLGASEMCAWLDLSCFSKSNCTCC